MTDEEARNKLKELKVCKSECDFKCQLYDLRENLCAHDIALGMAIQALEQQPKRGKWIDNPNEEAGEGYFICSECKEDVYESTDFCPNCGADMREVKTDEMSI